jgi:hypothetical protein
VVLLLEVYWLLRGETGPISGNPDLATVNTPACAGMMTGFGLFWQQIHILKASQNLLQASLSSIGFQFADS